MTQYPTTHDLISAAATLNISSGIDNTFENEYNFIKKSVMVHKNAYDAKNYGIIGKCSFIKGIGYATI